MAEPIIIDSILEDVKKFCMLTKDNDEFDSVITIHINSAFASLKQMGVGPQQGFKIRSYDEKWSDYFGNKDFVENVKEYVCIKTKLSFDTPQASGMKEALENQLAETEYRVRIQWDDEFNMNNEDDPMPPSPTTYTSLEDFHYGHNPNP